MKRLIGIAASCLCATMIFGVVDVFAISKLRADRVRAEVLKNPDCKTERMGPNTTVYRSHNAAGDTLIVVVDYLAKEASYMVYIISFFPAGNMKHAAVVRKDMLTYLRLALRGKRLDEALTFFGTAWNKDLPGDESKRHRWWDEPIGQIDILTGKNVYLKGVDNNLKTLRANLLIRIQ